MNTNLDISLIIILLINFSWNSYLLVKLLVRQKIIKRKIDIIEITYRNEKAQLADYLQEIRNIISNKTLGGL